MLFRSLIACSSGILVSFISLAVLAGSVNENRKSELKHLLKHDCGSCHGMTLKGGLGPALTPDALINKPKAYLLHTITEGHPGTPMPPWKLVLAPDDIEYLVELLTAGVNPS